MDTVYTSVILRARLVMEGSLRYTLSLSPHISIPPPCCSLSVRPAIKSQHRPRGRTFRPPSNSTQLLQLHTRCPAVSHADEGLLLPSQAVGLQWSAS
jgi:hypothetical protein